MSGSMGNGAMTRTIKRLAAAGALLAGLSGTGAVAQEIKPLDVYQDPNGIDLTSNNVSSAKMPTLAIPAAPELAFRNLEDFTPLLVVTPDSSEPGFDPVLYQINAGSIASDAFATCTVIQCTSEKGTGSKLVGPGDPTFEGGPYQYKQGGTGRFIYFDIRTIIWDGGPQNNTVHKYLASTIYSAGNNTLTFTYDSANILYAERHRVSSVASSSGYTLNFTYLPHGSDPYNWGILHKAEIVKTSAPGTVLASLTYSGNTVTDIAGRIYECVCQPNLWGEDPQLKGSRMKLPGESVYAFDTSRQAGSNVRTVTADGVTYTYTAVPDGNWNPTHQALDSMTITGPDGFYRHIDVTNVAPTTGELDGPRKRIDSVTDSQNQTTYYQYDGTQRLKKIIYPAGNSLEVFYNANGSLTQKIARAPGEQDLVETAAYNNCGGMLCWYYPDWTQDAEGNRTDYTFDPGTGVMLSSLAPADASGLRAKTKYSYTTTGPKRVIREELCAADANGVEQTCGGANSFVRKTTYLGDTSLPLTETVTDGADNAPLTTTYTYDSAGRLKSQDGPLPGTDDAVYHYYDPGGRKIWDIAPKGENGYRQATRTYYRNADDQVEKVVTGRVTDANHTSFVESYTHTDTAYNSRRLPWRVTVQAEGSTSYTAYTNISYDSRNRETCTAVRMDETAFASAPSDACQLTPGGPGPDGYDRITRKSYDSEDRVLKIERAVNAPEHQDYAQYTYTVDGLQETMTDARGYTAKMAYDGHRRQTRWYMPLEGQTGGHDPNDYEEYTYDRNSNRLTLRKRDGSVLSFTYDDLNRVIRKTVPARAGLDPAHTKDVFYTYDIRGLQTRAQFDAVNGPGIVSHYDRYGRLTLTTDSSSGVSRQLTNYYDVGGNRVNLLHGWTNALFTYVYNAGGQFEQLKDPYGNVLVDYDYDDRDQLERGTRVGTALALDYDYDPLGRIADFGYVQNAVRYPVWQYTRNAASQIASQALHVPGMAWSGFAAKDLAYTANGQNEYTAVAGGAYCHDDNGNLTADGNLTAGTTNVYLYDVENRLVEMRAANGGTCAAIAYTGTLKAQLRYDPMGRLLEVKGYANGVLTDTRLFLHDGDALVAEFNASGTLLASHVHGPAAGVDDPLVTYEGQYVMLPYARLLYADPRGSIIYRSDSANANNVINTYDEYGQPAAANVGRFGYTGQVWLEALGMNYYKARIYAPRLGRFLQTDPIGYEDQINLYAYVGNDPVNGVDPTGTTTMDPDDKGPKRFNKREIVRWIIELATSLVQPENEPQGQDQPPVIEEVLPPEPPQDPPSRERTQQIPERPRPQATPLPRNTPIPKPNNPPPEIPKKPVLKVPTKPIVIIPRNPPIDGPPPEDDEES